MPTVVDPAFVSRVLAACAMTSICSRRVAREGLAIMTGLFFDLGNRQVRAEPAPLTARITRGINWRDPPRSRGIDECRGALAALGLTLPPPVVAPPPSGFRSRSCALPAISAYIAGHAPQGPDRTRRTPARQGGHGSHGGAGLRGGARPALSIPGSLQRALGDLDRVTRWLLCSAW